MSKMTLGEFCDRVRDVELFERRTSYYSGFNLKKDSAEWVEEFLKFNKLPHPSTDCENEDCEYYEHQDKLSRLSALLDNTDD